MFNLKIMEDKVMLPTISKRTFSPFYMSNLFDDDFFCFNGKQDEFNASCQHQGR